MGQPSAPAAARDVDGAPLISAPAQVLDRVRRPDASCPTFVTGRTVPRLPSFGPGLLRRPPEGEGPRRYGVARHAGEDPRSRACLPGAHDRDQPARTVEPVDARLVGIGGVPWLHLGTKTRECARDGAHVVHILQRRQVDAVRDLVLIPWSTRARPPMITYCPPALLERVHDRVRVEPRRLSFFSIRTSRCRSRSFLRRPLCASRARASRSGSRSNGTERQREVEAAGPQYAADGREAGSTLPTSQRAIGSCGASRAVPRQLAAGRGRRGAALHG